MIESNRIRIKDNAQLHAGESVIARATLKVASEVQLTIQVRISYLGDTADEWTPLACQGPMRKLHTFHDLVYEHCQGAEHHNFPRRISKTPLIVKDVLIS